MHSRFDYDFSLSIPKVLTDNKILSAPVIDESNLPIAFLSVYHLMEHFFSIFSENDFVKDSFWTSVKHWFKDSQTKWKEETVSQVLGKFFLHLTVI
jgi:hypothetical protein